jgi:hypothetical protein
MSNNKIILNGCIEQFKIDNELASNESETFEMFSLTQVTKAKDFSFEDIQNSLVDGGNDGGIDSVIVTVDDFIPETIEDLVEIKYSRKTQVSIVISQCKKEASFKESSIDKLITSLPELFSLEKSEDALLVRFNPNLVEKALIAREAWKKCTVAGGQLNILFNYCSFAEHIEINSGFISKTNQLKDLAQKQFVGSKVEYANFSSAELLQLYQSHKDERFSLTFKETPLSTSYKTHGIGYVGTVKLADYKSFLSDEDLSIRENLFESNIRHFQGSVDVNEKIRGTVESTSIEDFWWLNNGITIIADNPSLVGTTLSFDNVQIVNGLQTSYSIFLHHNGDINDSRSVLVKVIINDNKTTVDHIIASTNSQNPVSPSLLRATDDVQREIELFFQNEGFFYDRRKNYYKNQGKPAAKIFGIQTNAQAIEAIIFNNPHVTRSKPTSLIKDDSAYNRIFSQSYNYKIYLVCCLLAQKTAEFYRSIEDSNSKTTLSNFKLHLARVGVSFIIGKAVVTKEEVATIDLASYEQTQFDNAVLLIEETINNYRASNPTANLINMAKTKQFTDFLIGKLNDKF